MVKVLLFIFTTVSIFGQNFNITVYGITVAKATWTINYDTVNLKYKTEGLANLLWPAKNWYSTILNPKDYKLNSFTKKINQGALQQSASFNINSDSLVYKD